MAQKCEVWRAVDGTFWQTQAECLAWETKLFLMGLGKKAEQVKVSDDGRINPGDIQAILHESVQYAEAMVKP